MADFQTPILTLSPGVTFDASDVSPNNGVYITPADTLFLTVWSLLAGQTVQVSSRIILPDGTISFNVWQYITLGNRQNERATFNVPEGFLISLNVISLGTGQQRGTLFVAVQVQRGAFGNFLLGQTLCQGYVTQQSNVFYPGAQDGYAFEGRGHIRTITGTTPAAGAEVSEVVPAGAMWRVIAFNYNLITSATVAGRQSTLTYTDGLNIYALMSPPSAQPASNSDQYHWGDGLALTSGFNGIFNAPLVREAYLTAGLRIQTETILIQTGDQYSGVTYLVEEWLQP